MKDDKDDGEGEVKQVAYLVGIPQVMEEYVPPLLNLPSFLLALGVDCNWEQEKLCFDTVSRAIASFYQLSHPSSYLNVDGSPSSSSSSSSSSFSSSSSSSPSLAWQVENLMLPCMRDNLLPSRGRAVDGTITLVARLENLYKIFERC
jgi:DNA mismatch repair protein MLH1